jgi:hypothetical protein
LIGGKCGLPFVSCFDANIIVSLVGVSEVIDNVGGEWEGIWIFDSEVV